MAEGEEQKEERVTGSSSQPETRKEKHRRTRGQISTVLSEIRQQMLDGASNEEIMDALNIPERTFYRYMDKIYREDSLQLQRQNNKALATHIAILRDRLLHTIHNCYNMATDENVPVKDRIKAERLKIDTSILLLKLEYEGTTIAQIKQYDYDVKADMHEQQQQPDLGALF